MEEQLFKTWLAQTRELQIGSFGQDPGLLTGKDRVQYIKDMKIALDDEMSEAMKEISWKPWASAEFFNREAFVGEMVDLLHFAANLLVAAQCTDEELEAAYQEKMQRNRERQAAGYTGLHKCADCTRAIDDVLAHTALELTEYQSQTDYVNALLQPICVDCAYFRGIL